MIQSEIAVLITTKGRPSLVADLIKLLHAQTRPPDHIFVVGSHPDDLISLDRGDSKLTCLLGRKGRSARVNDAIMAAGGDYRYLVFFDDDFLPSRFWIEQALGLFTSSPDIIGITGQIVAGGADSHGVSPIDARTIVDLRDGFPIEGPSLDARYGLLGCNMAVRRAAVGGVWLDETLPVGSWLADADFCARIARRGRVGRAPQMYGVKMNQHLNREAGKVIGLAQIVNSAQLARKGSFSLGFAAKFMAQSIFANGLRALLPEPYIDRRGRLLGNLQGLYKLMTTPAKDINREELSVAPYPNQRRSAMTISSGGVDLGRGGSSNPQQHRTMPF
jgi:GT2 family glycosyltransferase